MTAQPASLPENTRTTPQIQRPTRPPNDGRQQYLTTETPPGRERRTLKERLYDVLRGFRHPKPPAYPQYSFFSQISALNFENDKKYGIKIRLKKKKIEI